ncbi:MAG: long-chain fatty acid--CoA ligase [Candidatus Riflebacteria bacterium HGW-Riflebacteria-1]|jgi:long-chain acyl-CoA synthetase|nr:MAG: long-chain fatty acid--CoA ligase [Candidatus Riflebacteria bacterium HGW-Riflebacteria-1]
MGSKNWLKMYDAVVPHEITGEIPSLVNFIDSAATRYADLIALVDGEKRTTYREFVQQTGVIAGNLRIQGIEKQDRIAIFLPNRSETILSFWGVIRSGAIGVMTNPLYMESELVHQFNDSGARFLITSEQLWAKVAPIMGNTRLEKAFIITDTGEQLAQIVDNQRVYSWETLQQSNAGYSCSNINPREDLALLQYTGGTTGVSKGCMLTHANLAANALQSEKMFHVLQPGVETFVGVLPYFHIYGLTVTIILPVLMGGTMLPLQRFTPKALLTIIETEKVTCMASAPSIFNACLSQKDIDNYDLSTLKLIISGSAPLPVSQMELFEQKTGARIVEGYGLSETSPVTHFNPITGNRKPGSIGLPLPSTEAKIVDVEYGTREMPDGEHGEIVIRGPQVMKGYYQQPGQTDMVLRDGWIYTGDIGYRDVEGYFYVTDRKKDLIISGGYNIYPREVEEILFKYPKIKEAVVVGMQHPTRGETPKAFVVPVEGETIDRKDIIDFCRKNMANYKVPRDIEFRDNLPKSAVGKVLRRLLRDETRA